MKQYDRKETMLPLEIMPQLAEPVIPDESAYKADEIRNPLIFNMIRLFLDPGSRPALRDLAGMTNCDTVS